MEPSSPKKIQFAVPPLQGQLDPQAAEHIRRRRPTPATLQIYRQPGTDAGDQNKASGESQASDPSQRKQSTYAPPTMKGGAVTPLPQNIMGSSLVQAPPLCQRACDGAASSNRDSLRPLEEGTGKLENSVPEEDEEEVNRQSDS